MSNFDTCKHLWAYMMVGVLDSVEPQDQKDQPTIIAKAIQLIWNINSMIGGKLQQFVFSRLRLCV